MGTVTKEESKSGARKAVNLLKKAAVGIAVLDLILAFNDSRNVGRFFLLLTMSSTFDITPENVIRDHCQNNIQGICETYARIVDPHSIPPAMEKGGIGHGVRASSFVQIRNKNADTEPSSSHLKASVSLQRLPEMFKELVMSWKSTFDLSRTNTNISFHFDDDASRSLLDGIHQQQFSSDSHVVERTGKVLSPRETSNVRLDISTQNHPFPLHPSYSTTINSNADLTQENKPNSNSLEDVLVPKKNKSVTHIVPITITTTDDSLSTTTIHDLSSTKSVNEIDRKKRNSLSNIESADIQRKLEVVQSEEEKHSNFPIGIGLTTTASSRGKMVMMSVTGSSRITNSQEVPSSSEPFTTSRNSDSNANTGSSAITEIDIEKLPGGSGDDGGGNDIATSSLIRHGLEEELKSKSTPAEGSEVADEMNLLQRYSIPSTQDSMSRIPAQAVQRLSASSTGNDHLRNSKKSAAGSGNSIGKSNKTKVKGKSKSGENEEEQEFHGRVTTIPTGPKKLMGFLQDELFSRWAFLMGDVQALLKEQQKESKNASKSDDASIEKQLVSSEAERIKMHIELKPFGPDPFKDTRTREKAVQQVLFDYPWMTMFQLRNKLSGSFTKIFIVVSLYSWIWSTAIALMLLIGSLTEDATTLLLYSLFNILYSLLLFMIDDWIHSNIDPVRSSVSVWLFILYSLYKPLGTWIVLTQWSEMKKLVSLQSSRRNCLTTLQSSSPSSLLSLSEESSTKDSTVVDISPSKSQTKGSVLLASMSTLNPNILNAQSNHLLEEYDEFEEDEEDDDNDEDDEDTEDEANVMERGGDE